MSLNEQAPTRLANLVPAKPDAVAVGTTRPLQADEEGSVVSLLVVGPGMPRVIPLLTGVDVRIGRAQSADVVIEDSSLSRHHAVFRLVDDHVELEDCGSSNGTVVRGSRIAAGQRVRIEIGDSVQLGGILIVVQRRNGSIFDRQLPSALAAPRDEVVARIAASNISVLLLGETGVGKEVMAERIHALSSRRGAPLVKINCAALMASVLESELFGHERGAFTGATKEKPGLIESADGGTLFLDEIAEAPLGVQVKLLRVLETRETQRIGALRPTIVDVRFIAATNRIPADQIRSGDLRADLYHRLAGFTITIPPLRMRGPQIPELVKDLLARHAAGTRGPLTVHPDAIARLVRHDWPGNVRELRNVLDRAVVLTDGAEISLADIEHAFQLAPAVDHADRHNAAASKEHLADPERVRILEVLEECGGNQSMAAERLQMSRRALVYRLQAWGMTRPRRRLALSTRDVKGGGETP